MRRPIGRTIHCSTALPTVKANVTDWFARMMLKILIVMISCADFVAGARKYAHLSVPLGNATRLLSILTFQMTYNPHQSAKSNRSTIATCIGRIKETKCKIMDLNHGVDLQMQKGIQVISGRLAGTASHFYSSRVQSYEPVGNVRQ